MANDVKSIKFSSASASAIFFSASAGASFSSAQPSMEFSSVQPSTEFSSASQSIAMADGGVLQRLLKEDGFAIRTESGFNLLKEQQ